MSVLPISISKIGQILRIYRQSNSKPSIAAQAEVSRNTAKKYFAAFDVSGYTFDQINGLNDKELDDFFGTNVFWYSNFNAVRLINTVVSYQKK